MPVTIFVWGYSAPNVLTLNLVTKWKYYNKLYNEELLSRGSRPEGSKAPTALGQEASATLLRSYEITD